jgi:signal transduction histidine kinase
MYVMDRYMNKFLETDLLAIQASQELENALVMQKGNVTYYFQDGDPAWLDELQKHDTSFETWLRQARQFAETKKERDILKEIDSQYLYYSKSRDDVVNLYKEGKVHEGYELHKNARNQFFRIIGSCREYKTAYLERINDVQESLRERAGLISALAISGLVMVLFLGIVLAYILLNQVLGPIRRLAVYYDERKNLGIEGNEVKALSQSFENLVHDVDLTRTKLELSQEHLVQAEKWALVGKLAAGLAHSVRNPLTSVKMRLFSLERTLKLTASQKEDLEVISEEISHIDTIAGNFLEFSRPPRLKTHKISPSDSVDMAIQLLKHRLESYDVKVDLIRDVRLPEIQADPDQLKEVFVNLIVNACEAMVSGGHIVIRENKEFLENKGTVLVIEMKDDGPGIPVSIQDKLFQPFFSAKEEGTGLGLSIVQRIIEEHGGWVELESLEGKGALFRIKLPVSGDVAWEKY